MISRIKVDKAPLVVAVTVIITEEISPRMHHIFLYEAWNHKTTMIGITVAPKVPARMA
jgi:hypothetical protein